MKHNFIIERALFKKFKKYFKNKWILIYIKIQKINKFNNFQSLSDWIINALSLNSIPCNYCVIKVISYRYYG